MAAFGSNLNAVEYQNSGVRIIRLRVIRPHDFARKQQVRLARERATDARIDTISRPGDLDDSEAGRSDWSDLHFPDDMLLRSDRSRSWSDFAATTIVHHAYVIAVLELAGCSGANVERGRWNDHGSGSTHKAQVVQIPLPPLAEQKRIAGILDAADALRAKRRESLAQLDTLLQSTFLDMFGDPVTNPMGWEVKTIKR